MHLNATIIIIKLNELQTTIPINEILTEMNTKSN